MFLRTFLRTAYSHVRTEPQSVVGHTRGKKKTLECPRITIFSEALRDLTTPSGPWFLRSQGPAFFQLKKTPFHLLPPGRSHDLAASLRSFFVESILL